MLSTTQRRGFLWRIYDLTTTLTATATTYATLLAAVQAVGAANFTITSTGTITAVAGNGKSVTLGAAASGATPVDYAEAAAALRDLYQDSRAAIISSGIASPTDAQIFTEMKFRLQPVTELAPSNFAALRCA